MNQQQISDQQLQNKMRTVQQISQEIKRVIVGQDVLIERLIIALLCHGHVLIEGLPGLAKTLTVKTLASAIDGNFKRIQFTPDLLPSDVIGTQIYLPQSGQFSVKQGAIFSNIVLADEINRAPAKVQSALLQAMEERQVTIGDQTFQLDEPFLVLATQNPIEQEGTYPLPEAQLDRFLFKVVVTYPSRNEEREIINRMVIERDEPINIVVNRQEIGELRKAVDAIYIDERIKDYVLDIVRGTRKETSIEKVKPFVDFGASPRATLALLRSAKALAFLRGRAYVVPDDVKNLVYDVLRHRLILSFEAEADAISADAVIKQILDSIEIP
jgi:MoxR-like ATPase